jgi:hypothetical protein
MTGIKCAESASTALCVMQLQSDLYHLYLYQLKTQVDPLAIKTVDPSYYFIIHCGGTTISIQIFVLKKTQDE